MSRTMQDTGWAAMAGILAVINIADSFGNSFPEAGFDRLIGGGFLWVCLYHLVKAEKAA